MKKKSKSKEAKFFCESCGSEVPRSSKVCPTCGKFFASVRCPQCGRIGSNDDFKNGCPTCGYAVNPDDLTNRKYNGIPGVAATEKGFGLSGKRKKAGAERLFGNVFSTNGFSESSLPFWVYAVSLIVLFALIVCLYSCL